VWLDPFKKVQTKATKYQFDRSRVPSLLYRNNSHITTPPASCYSTTPCIYWYLYNNYTEALTLFDETTDLKETDDLIIIFNRIKTHPEEEQFVAFSSFKGSSIGDEMTLVPGNYTLMAILIENEMTIIPAQNRTYPHVPDPIPMPEHPQPISPRLSGGAIISPESEHLVEIRPNALYSDATTLVFPIIEIPKPYLIDHLQEMGLIENFTSEYRQRLQPHFTFE